VHAGAPDASGGGGGGGGCGILGGSDEDGGGVRPGALAASCPNLTVVFSLHYADDLTPVRDGDRFLNIAKDDGRARGRST